MSSTPSVHSVQFYDSHEALIDRLCGIASSGLLVGNSILIVATEQHREQLIAALYKLEVDVRDYAREGRFIMCDAEELLVEFMVDGCPILSSSLRLWEIYSRMPRRPPAAKTWGWSSSARWWQCCGMKATG